MRNLIYNSSADPQTAHSRDVVALATKCLVERGWLSAQGAAFATKQYMTAVGLKSAAAYLMDGGNNSEIYTLTADYQSEGRNALGSLWQAIPKNAVEHEITNVVLSFASQADVAVSQTYAAKLYLTALDRPNEESESADRESPAGG